MRIGHVVMEEPAAELLAAPIDFVHETLGFGLRPAFAAA